MFQFFDQINHKNVFDYHMLKNLFEYVHHLVNYLNFQIKYHKMIEDSLKNIINLDEIVILCLPV